MERDATVAARCGPGWDSEYRGQGPGRGSAAAALGMGLAGCPQRPSGRQASPRSRAGSREGGGSARPVGVGSAAEAVVLRCNFARGGFSSESVLAHVCVCVIVCTHAAPQGLRTALQLWPL